MSLQKLLRALKDATANTKTTMQLKFQIYKFYSVKCYKLFSTSGTQKYRLNREDNTLDYIFEARNCLYVTLCNLFACMGEKKRSSKLVKLPPKIGENLTSGLKVSVIAT